MNNPKETSRGRRWLALVPVIGVAVAGGLWFAHAHGWLSRGYAWVQQRWEERSRHPATAA